MLLNLLRISEMGSFLIIVVSYAATKTVMSENYEKPNIFMIILDTHERHEI